MRRIREKAARLRRFPRGRGFGVQSPNDYNFITKVVKGRIGSLCCSEADRNNADLRSDGYKFVHLCYRIAQYLKPSYCLVMCSGDDVSRYVEAAVPEVKIVSEYGAENRGRLLAVISVAENDDRSIRELIAAATDNTWVIIEGIRTDKKAYKLWLDMASSDKARITFDLYHYGVICFDRKRYKQNYKIYL